MELVLQRYGSFEVFQQVTGGSLLTKSRIWHNVKKYMEKEGCLGEVGRTQRCIKHEAASVGASSWATVDVFAIVTERQAAGRRRDKRVCGKR